jgi:hypothetical protein
MIHQEVTMTDAIAHLWVVTFFALLLGAWLPGGLPALFSPDSRMARGAGIAICLGIAVAAVAYRQWQTTILGTPVHVLASIGLVAYIWVRVLQGVVQIRRSRA